MCINAAERIHVYAYEKTFAAPPGTIITPTRSAYRSSRDKTFRFFPADTFVAGARG